MIYSWNDANFVIKYCFNYGSEKPTLNKIIIVKRKHKYIKSNCL